MPKVILSRGTLLVISHAASSRPSQKKDVCFTSPQGPWGGVRSYYSWIDMIGYFINDELPLVHRNSNMSTAILQKVQKERGPFGTNRSWTTKYVVGPSYKMLHALETVILQTARFLASSVMVCDGFALVGLFNPAEKTRETLGIASHWDVRWTSPVTFNFAKARYIRSIWNTQWPK